MLAQDSAGLVVIDRDHFQELFEAPEDQLSFNLALIKGGAFDYGFHGNVRNAYHADVIRNQLTQSLGGKMPDIVDELNAAFADELESIITDGIKRVCVANIRVQARCVI